MTNEIWMPVYGHEESYMVSDLGSVKSLDRYVKYCTGKIVFSKGKTLSPGLASTGYLTVSLKTNERQISYCVQILVLEAFVCPRPEGMMGLHSDAIRTNNKLDNLRWGTSSDNAQDQIKNNTFNFSKGEKHQLAKLSNKTVLEIKKLISIGERSCDIARKMNLPQRQISKIKTGTRWSHLKLIDL